MPRQIIHTANEAKTPATYSQAVKAAGLVFVSGTTPLDRVTGQIVGDTIQRRTRQCLTNIAAILEAAGSSLDKIVGTTVIMADEDDVADSLPAGCGKVCRKKANAYAGKCTLTPVSLCTSATSEA